MIEVKQLKDYLGLSTIGFFQRIDAQLAALTDPVTPPWSPYITSAELDKLYYLNHKKKLVSDWWEDMEGDTDAGKDAIASELWGIYGVKWSHLFKIFQAQYDPLENYDRMEDSTRTLEKTGKEKTKRTPDLTRTFEKEGEEENKRERNTTDTDKTLVASEDIATNKRAAFNSSAMLDVGGQELRHTDSREQKGTGDITDTLSFDNRKDTEKQTGTDDTELSFENRKDTERVTGRIHGNIGVTTAAQMMTGDKEAWDSLKLIERMLMDDLNEQLTLPIY